MEMHDHWHPGEIVREARLKSLGLTVTAAAEALGVTAKALSDLELLAKCAGRSDPYMRFWNILE
jgi:plasmid maintenance system antidote protein VapI